MPSNLRLFHADCRDVLPAVGIDTVITDPLWPNAPEDYLKGVDPQKLLAETLSLIDARRVVIVLRGDSDPRFLQAVPSRYPFFRAQILPYVIPAYIGRKLGGDEIAYCFGEPIPSSIGRSLIPGWGPRAQPSKRKANGHPMSRALVHMAWLVNWWSLPGETILDPFMGSGTTGEAALQQERNFIGIEIEQKYFDIAAGRLNKMQMPLQGTGIC